MTADLWYPEFGLMDDPFRFKDYNTEYLTDPNRIPRIKTAEVERIKQVQSSCVIVGAPGDGKSTILSQAAKELKSKKQLFTVIAATSITNFYDNLYYQLSLHHETKGELEKVFQKFLNLDWFEVKYKYSEEGGRNLLDGIHCHYPRCIFRKRCKIRTKEPTEVVKMAFDVNRLNLVLERIEKYCPLKVYCIQNMINCLESDVESYKFLLDVPDDLYKGIDDFKETIRNMQICGPVVIMATNDQYERLRKSDAFRRLQKFEFKQMTNNELKQLIENRIKWMQIEGDYPPLFTDEAWDYILKKSVNNPRIVLEICEEVVLAMKMEQRTISADVQFVEGKSTAAHQFTVDEHVMMLVKKYVKEKRRWVSVKESVVDMLNLYDVDINEASLGRKLAILKLKGMIKDHRNNPDSQYRYFAGPLDED